MPYSASHRRSGGLTTKDFITIGIFSAIIFICILIGGGVFAVNPALTFFYPLGASLLPGPAFLLMTAKVPRRGPITTTGLLVGFFMFITGMHWAMALGYSALGVAADLAAGLGKYRSKAVNVLAYIIFCLGGTGSYLAFFASPASWMKAMLEKGTAQDYLDTMNAAASPYMLFIMLAGTVIVAGLSGFAGTRLLKKQFEKAGIAA